MGIISRKVLPACGNLCICCPELRARSRQPVKRYKKLLSDIFPKSKRLPRILGWFKCVHIGVRELQDEPPNDRKIGKLTEYASKNPLRIPKIASGLEQRGYKALRSERYGTVRVVMRAYSKLLSSCRDQMPLFASSALSMIRVLFDQGRNDSMQNLACSTVVDFVNYQMDATYMRDLDSMLPKLCGLSRETGDEHRRFPLRAAGLQALASLISFMGKYSHIPPEFDDVVAVVLENYDTPLPDQDSEALDRTETNHNWVKEVLKGEGRGPVAVMTGAFTKLQSQKDNFLFRDPLNLTRTEIEIPKVWSQICVQNMARLAKEATTVRRVLEPMFRYFDTGKHWPPEKGLALAVLRDMQAFMEHSGNEQLSLPVLVRHLDHKTVVNNPELKISIVEVTSHLARQSKAKATVADVGAMSDLLRHLRKSIQSSLESSKIANPETVNMQKVLQNSLEECLIELAKRVNDAAPLFDMMASTLEKLSANPIISRAATEAVFVLAHCMAYVPDQSYAEQVFPEASFQELLQAMIHPDVETRAKAHHIFALLLVPSSLIARSDDLSSAQSRPETSSTLSRSTSAFGSAAALFEKLRREKSGFGEREGFHEATGYELGKDNTEGIELTEIGAARNKDAVGGAYSLSPNRHYGFKLSKERSRELSMDRSLAHLRRSGTSVKDLGLSVVRLSGYQAALLLSALWLQATLPDNVPASYEAIANSYILTLLFSRAKTSSHKTVIRAFQLALSLRSMAIDQSCIQLPPSRRRSLFTLSTAMLVFAGRAYGVPQLGAVAKASLTTATMDPYLELSDDIRLKLVHSPAGYVNVKDYGTAADDRDALKSFSGVSFPEEQTPEALAALIVGSSTILEPDDFAVADQMLQPFSTGEGLGLGPQLYFGTPHSHLSPLQSRNSLSFDELGAATNTSMEDDLMTETSGGELPRLLASVPVPLLTPHIISVSKLLEAALETAGEVVNTSTADAPISYSAMASLCEIFGADSRKKITSVLKLEGEYSPELLTFPAPEEQQQGQPREVFRLPPSSPYDNFLKAAGC